MNIALKKSPLIVGSLVGVGLFLHARLITIIPFVLLGFVIFKALKKDNFHTYFSHALRICYQPWVWLLTALLIWSSLSIFWSQHMSLALQTWLKVLTYSLTLIGLYVSPFLISSAEKKKFFEGCLWVFLTLGLLIIIDQFSNFSLMALTRQKVHYATNHRGIFILYFIAPALIVSFKNIGSQNINNIWILFFFFFFGYILSCEQVHLSAALFLHGLLFITWLFTPVIPWRKFFKILAMSLMILGIIIPYAMNQLSLETCRNISLKIPKLSHVHRLFIYKEASEKIAQRPFLGYGLEVCRGDSFTQEICLGDVVSPRNPSYAGKHTVPLLKHHPHNFLLQWWLELGAPGALIYLVLIYYALTHLGTRTQLEGFVGFLFAAPYLVVGLVSYGFWQSWIHSSFLLTLFIYRLAFFLPKNAN